MSGQKILKVINPVMALLFVMIISSALLREHLHGKAYQYLHMLPGLAFGALGLTHIIINRGWFKAVYCTKK